MVWLVWLAICARCAFTESMKHDVKKKIRYNNKAMLLYIFNLELASSMNDFSNSISIPNP